MNYYYLPPNHSLAKRIKTFVEEQNSARQQWRELGISLGADNVSGWNFTFVGDKKPNKHWIKSKKQRGDRPSFIPNPKTEEGKSTIEKLKSMPELVGSGIMMMLCLFGNDPNVVIKDENSFHDQTFDFVREHGNIGFQVSKGEVYMEGSDFWLFDEKDGVVEISNIDYRNA